MQLRASGVLLILILGGIALGAVFMLSAGGQHAVSATEGQVDSIAMSSSRDFIYASQPQSPTEDTVMVTAQLYSGGKPLKKAGVPVDFSLSDDRFARLDVSRSYTDQWGTASARVSSYDSGKPLPEHPFPLSVKASAEGRSASIALPMTGYVTLAGKVTDKKGEPVEGATVSMLLNRTHVPIKAGGSTATTNIDGKYRLDRVPTDLGNVVIYVKKGSIETAVPANISSMRQMR
jgi:hypothetical protein